MHMFVTILFLFLCLVFWKCSFPINDFFLYVLNSGENFNFETTKLGTNYSVLFFFQPKKPNKQRQMIILYAWMRLLVERNWFIESLKTLCFLLKKIKQQKFYKTKQTPTMQTNNKWTMFTKHISIISNKLIMFLLSAAL